VSVGVESENAMKVLIFGGTMFLGRHLVEALLARGHEVTLFNRGRTRPELFTQLEQLRGERDGKLEALAQAVNAGRHWDAAIDCCGYVPRVVRQSAALLRDAVGRYLFVSSVSVYAEFSQPNTPEDAPLAVLSDLASEEVMRDYGALKAACEREVATVFADRSLVVRPGLIVGPWDPTGRFTYWVQRAAEGGEMLAPGDPHAPVQVIDARDLAAWIVAALEQNRGGVFNLAGPVGGCSFDDLLSACCVAAPAAAATTVTWVSAEFLAAHKVAPWSELPLWLPHDDGGRFTADIRRAIDTGLVTRPVAGTARDTLAWARANPNAVRSERHPPAGISREREAQLLAEWRMARAR
jgi:2'-hydroxyisoflavone reductase